MQNNINGRLYLTFSNLLSLSRVILSPGIVFLMLAGTLQQAIALAIFLLASITDFFDGYVARKYNTQSSLGAFLDPLADKILIFSTFFGFYLLDMVALWMVIVIVLRDVGVTLLRIIMLRHGRELATSKAAKLKTTVQFGAVCVLFATSLLSKDPRFFSFIPIMMYAVVLFTICTGLTYLSQIWKKL